MFADPPPWAQALLSLRHRLVRPFGLKTDAVAGEDAVNGFPVLRADDSTAVLGLDDKHLDFRIVLTVTPRDPSGFALRVTTLVRRHGLAGRAYLVAVMPFHRLIVPATMAWV